MTRRNIRVAVAHDPHIPGTWITDLLPQEEDVDVTEVVESLSPESDAIQLSDADVLLVACNANSDEALELVEWWVGHRIGHPVLVLSQSSENGFVQRVFEAGADDLVELDPDAEYSPATARNLDFALHKAMVRRVAGDERAALGTTICVLGPKGGIGKTVTSCNLALALAGNHNRVAIVDLDLQFGDVALSLGLRPGTTSYDLAISGGSLDAEKVDAFLVTHPTGLRVLAAPVRPDQSGLVTPELMSNVITILRSMFDYVILDTPPTFTPGVISAIDAATYVCMIGMLDALSLKNTRLGLETLELMGYAQERIRIVLNRANTNVGITGHDVASILGREPDILVPSSREITRSVNEGEPIVLSQKRSDGAKAFNALAGLFAKPAVPPPAARRRNLSLFGRGAG